MLHPKGVNEVVRPDPQGLLNKKHASGSVEFSHGGSMDRAEISDEWEVALVGQFDRSGADDAEEEHRHEHDSSGTGTRQSRGRPSASATIAKLTAGPTGPSGIDAKKVSAPSVLARVVDHRRDHAPLAGRSHGTNTTTPDSVLLPMSSQPTQSGLPHVAQTIAAGTSTSSTTSSSRTSSVSESSALRAAAMAG
jgi:hypothetical protein